jgi:hypothetical protein
MAHITGEISAVRIRMRVAEHYLRPLCQFFVRAVTAQTPGHADRCSRIWFRRPMAAFAAKPRLDVFVGTA